MIKREALVISADFHASPLLACNTSHRLCFHLDLKPSLEIPSVIFSQMPAAKKGALSVSPSCLHSGTCYVSKTVCCDPKSNITYRTSYFFFSWLLWTSSIKSVGIHSFKSLWLRMKRSELQKTNKLNLGGFVWNHFPLMTEGTEQFNIFFSVIPVRISNTE